MGCNSEGKLYKVLVCFMTAGLKNSIPYVIKSSPETKINVDWLKEELVSGFAPIWFRAIVCDNHLSVVSKICCNNLIGIELFSMHELRKIYFFYDAVHLAKNIY